MPDYTRYQENIETLDKDEQETHAKIIQLMVDGQNITREKYGKAVRISHAKAHGFLKGEFVVREDLPAELAQGLFTKPGTYPVLARFAQVPGEMLDDSKVSSPRGIAIKIFDVAGPKIPGYEGTNQDWLLDNGGKEFITGSAYAFLQAFKPNAEIAPKLSDTVKGAVSASARGANAVLNAVGFNSGKLDFYGHPKKHPLAEPYFSQTPYRYGEYIAKFGIVPTSPGLKALENQAFDPETPDALRDATVDYFRSNNAEFDFVVQLNTDLKEMSIEDATVAWSEEDSPYRTVARIVLPAQNAYDHERQDFVDGDLSFSPAHALAAHRPLGSTNRARLAAYPALSKLRREENHRPTMEPASIDKIPA